MINRLLIRTRAFQVAYAHYHRDEQKLSVAEKDLRLSLDRTYDLYKYLLWLPVALTERLEELVEIRRKKHFATDAERNPNTRLLANRLTAMIADSQELSTWYSDFGLNWSNESTLLKNLVEKIEQSDLYAQYLASEDGFEADQTFWVGAFHHIIAQDDTLAEYLEKQSLYWDDELANVEKIECEERPDWDQIETATEAARGTDAYTRVRLELGHVEVVKDFVLKSLKRATADEPFDTVVLPQYKDEEDETFAIHLLRQTLVGHERLSALIDSHVSESWQSERLADTDTLIIQLATSEFLHFPAIPVQVTINEYVEIAKHYSPPKSSAFINAILDAIAKTLRAEGKILK